MKKTILAALMAFLCLSVKAQQDTTNSDWKYTSNVDEMTNNKRYFATISSDPTDDNMVATLIIRYKEKENDAMLSIEHGVFNMTIYGIIAYIKFDDGKIEKFNCAGSASNNYGLIFFPAKRFIKALKTSKKMLIKIELYNKGEETFRFNTEGIVWEH